MLKEQKHHDLASDVGYKAGDRFLLISHNLFIGLGLDFTPKEVDRGVFMAHLPDVVKSYPTIGPEPFLSFLQNPFKLNPETFESRIVFMPLLKVYRAERGGRK